MNTELREELELLSGWDIPKCDVLEFLLEKLPTNTTIEKLEPTIWRAESYNFANLAVAAERRTPQEALMTVASMLFKEGILTK